MLYLVQKIKNKEVIPYLSKCYMCKYTENCNKCNGALRTVSFLDTCCIVYM